MWRGVYLFLACVPAPSRSSIACPVPRSPALCDPAPLKGFDRILYTSRSSAFRLTMLSFGSLHVCCGDMHPSSLIFRDRSPAPPSRTGPVSGRAILERCPYLHKRSPFHKTQRPRDGVLHERKPCLLRVTAICAEVIVIMLRFCSPCKSDMLSCRRTPPMRVPTSAPVGVKDQASIPSQMMSLAPKVPYRCLASGRSTAMRRQTRQVCQAKPKHCCLQN